MSVTFILKIYLGFASTSLCQSKGLVLLDEYGFNLSAVQSRSGS